MFGASDRLALRPNTVEALSGEVLKYLAGGGWCGISAGSPRIARECAKLFKKLLTETAIAFGKEHRKVFGVFCVYCKLLNIEAVDSSRAARDKRLLPVQFRRKRTKANEKVSRNRLV